MKQYILALRSSDFTRSGKSWTTAGIDLYSNQFYTNYSTYRSRFGLNTLGDNTFVGLEYASPSVSGANATPTIDDAVYVTDIGEIVADSASPEILRFVDTTSRVDILRFVGGFTNTIGLDNPKFKLTLSESDSQNGPWMVSTVAEDINIIFIRRSKKISKNRCTDNI